MLFCLLGDIDIILYKTTLRLTGGVTWSPVSFSRPKSLTSTLESCHSSRRQSLVFLRIKTSFYGIEILNPKVARTRVWNRYPLRSPLKHSAEQSEIWEVEMRSVELWKRSFALSLNWSFSAAESFTRWGQS